MTYEENRPTAYSYIRFSTKKQQLGDSLRRQVEAAERYARDNNLNLSERTFRDLGMSGFKQKNIKQGALAAFISAVKAGLIAPGSYLLIEQFDRLSRAEINVAFRLLLDLVDLDITVVTLIDEKVWDSETVQDVANVLTSIILMSRAHEESKTKSKRLSAVWGQKKERAQTNAPGTIKIVTSECPRWLAANADKTGFVVFEDLAESIRKVFAARIGGFGVVAIVNRANSDGWPVPGKPPIQGADEDYGTYEARKTIGLTWHTSLVGRILNNRAVLGEYQPFKTEHVKVKDDADKKVRVPVGEAIKGYYPSVIDEQTFLRAKAKTDRSGRFPGRRDASLKNWLQGLLKCNCGHSFVRKNKTSSKQPGYARYYCSARIRGISDCPSIGANEIEAAVLHAVSTVAPQFWNGSARLAELKATIDVLQVDLTAARDKRDRYVEAIGTSKAAIPPLLVRLSSAQEELDAAERSISAARAEISELDGDTESVFENIAAAVRNVDSLDARAALREDLSRVLEKCVVFARDGTVNVHLRGENVPITVPLNINATLPGITMKKLSIDEYAKFFPEQPSQL